MPQAAAPEVFDPNCYTIDDFVRDYDNLVKKINWLFGRIDDVLKYVPPPFHVFIKPIEEGVKALEGGIKEVLDYFDDETKWGFGNPCRLHAIAGQWRQVIAEQLTKIEAQIKDDALPTTGQWEGKPGDAYRLLTKAQRGKMNNLKSAAIKVADTLDKVANAIEAFYAGVGLAVVKVIGDICKAAGDALDAKSGETAIAGLILKIIPALLNYIVSLVKSLFTVFKTWHQVFSELQGEIEKVNGDWDCGSPGWWARLNQIPGSNGGNGPDSRKPTGFPPHKPNGRSGNDKGKTLPGGESGGGGGGGGAGSWFRGDPPGGIDPKLPGHDPGQVGGIDAGGKLQPPDDDGDGKLPDDGGWKTPVPPDGGAEPGSTSPSSEPPKADFMPAPVGNNPYGDDPSRIDDPPHIGDDPTGTDPAAAGGGDAGSDVGSHLHLPDDGVGGTYQPVGDALGTSGPDVGDDAVTGASHAADGLEGADGVDPHDETSASSAGADGLPSAGGSGTTSTGAMSGTGMSGSGSGGTTVGAAGMRMGGGAGMMPMGGAGGAGRKKDGEHESRYKQYGSIAGEEEDVDPETGMTIMDGVIGDDPQ